MIKKILGVTLLLLCLSGKVEARSYMWRLTLSDKQGTPYTLERPSQFLSERAIMRRIRQRLPLDSTDLPLSSVYLDSIARRGGKVVAQSKWNNSVLVCSDSLPLLESMRQLRFVKTAEMVYHEPDSLKPFECPRRTKAFSELKDTVDATASQLGMMNVDRLHAAGFRGQGMLVAVLDGGFQYADHIPALARIRKAGDRDFVWPRSGNIYREHSHGTKVLSVMAANEPGIFMGAAPEASYWLLRCENTQTEFRNEEDFWAMAAEFADSVGVDVINTSLGYAEFDDEAQGYPYSALDGQTMMISRMASLLARKGIVMVCSAGNEGDDTWKKITVPADAEDVLTVGAVTPDGVNAAFSSVGNTADGRVKPDVMAQGGRCAVITGEGEVVRQNGTSFASPLVAGAVACLWQALPEKTALEIIQLVRQGGDRYATPDNIYGYGIPDFWKVFENEKSRRMER